LLRYILSGFAGKLDPLSAREIFIDLSDCRVYKFMPPSLHGWITQSFV
jgi:hypothetical protein